MSGGTPHDSVRRADRSLPLGHRNGGQHVAALGVHSSVGPPADTFEFDILKDYISAQALCLLRKNSYEDFLLVRTLGDHHQHAAWEAKSGNLHAAAVQMRALQAMQPPDAELALACTVTAQPVFGLIEWKSGHPNRAVQCLHAALDAAARLAQDYDHDYLTARRVYLSANIARVYASTGDSHAAAILVAALLEVVNGAVDRWPFADSASLDVPLRGAAYATLAAQLTELGGAR